MTASVYFVSTVLGSNLSAVERLGYEVVTGIVVYFGCLGVLSPGYLQRYLRMIKNVHAPG